MKLVFLGLSITSSWGNGHATTYRALLRELAARGHETLFLERDVPWYASQRDLSDAPYTRIVLYGSVEELRDTYTAAVRDADAVIVGSYVPEGVTVGDWVLRTARGIAAFYDIDTPVTLAKMQRGEHDYLSPELIRRYRLYLSFTGGPTLQRLEQEYGSPRARALYCAVDPTLYHREDLEAQWDLGYMGTYSADRQHGLDQFMLQPALTWASGRFVVAGPLYPEQIRWPGNVERIPHLPPAEHRVFYSRQRFSLNLTRADMVAAGYSPSVRLFEAGACGTPVISDYWDGLEDFFELGDEMLAVRTGQEVLRFLREMSQDEAREIGEAARRRVLAQHTAAHRAAELEQFLLEVRADGNDPTAHRVAA